MLKTKRSTNAFTIYLNARLTRKLIKFLESIEKEVPSCKKKDYKYILIYLKWLWRHPNRNAYRNYCRGIDDIKAIPILNKSKRCIIIKGDSISASPYKLGLCLTPQIYGEWMDAFKIIKYILTESFYF